MRLRLARGVTENTELSVLDQWSEYLRACGQSTATARLRTRVVGGLMNHAGVDDPLELTRAHVLTFLARDRSQWTRVTYWQSIHGLSVFLREFGHDPDSHLTKGICKPRKPEPVARPIDDDTIGRVLAAPFTPRVKAYLRLALFAGLRVHEIAKIRGEDFDWPAGWLMVTGKGGFTAPVPIHPEIRRIAEPMPDYGFWFPSLHSPGHHVSPQSVSTTVTNALRSVGSMATAHQLRDTAATRIQRQVKDIRVTQSMLRHRSLKSTQKYTGVADEQMHAAVLALDWAA